jgi:hypothetical protein
MAATLTVPILGTAAQRAKQERSNETTTLQLPLIDCEVENNNFQQADSCTVTLDWRDTTLDTRALDDGVLTVYMGFADDNDRWTPTELDVVFIGHVRNPERELGDDSPGILRIEAIDYTGLFLEAKPFGSSGIPLYTDTFRQAWRRICSQTPGAEKLADRLIPRGGDVNLDVKLGDAVSERFAKLARVPTNPDTDAWSVWLQCVGSLGCISEIELDACIVTTATDLYTEVDPPVLAWGRNLTRLSESRQNVDIKGGVCISTFDPLTGKAIEVFYPPVGSKELQRKTIAATKKKAKPDSIHAERNKRHFFTLRGVTDRGYLEKIARNVYEQLSRQELSGKLATPEPVISRVSGADFNLLQLKAGDAIRVEFDPGQRQYLTELPSRGARFVYLLSQGYERGLADLLAANVEAFSKLGTTFYVDSVRKYMAVDGEAGEFEIECSFTNKIDVSKGALE